MVECSQGKWVLQQAGSTAPIALNITHSIFVPRATPNQILSKLLSQSRCRSLDLRHRMGLPSIIKKKYHKKSMVSAPRSLIDEGQQFKGLEWLQMGVVWVRLIHWEQD